MRFILITEGEYYHIYNRGNQKQRLFFDKKDWVRFLFILLYFQSPHSFKNIDRYIKHFLDNELFNVPKDEVNKIISDKYVELVNFSIMPNHFHLTLLNTKDKGIAQYMHRVLNAYAKYYNTKYEKTGHVFQGTYKAKHISTDNQLLYLSTYIHKNSRELTGWKNKEVEYPWSSYRDYKNNRWEGLLCTGVILDQFDTFEEYEQFVTESTAKETLNKLFD